MGSASDAQPILHDPDVGQLRSTGQTLIDRLKGTGLGQANAAAFQRLVYEILNFLFEPELTGGELEVTTYLGTERRDIIYWNEAERSFWAYVRSEYKSPLVMFECKNVAKLDNDHVNQTATYLGARLGMLGFIVTRLPASQAVLRKAFSVYNDSPAVPRKVVLILSDADLEAMVRERMQGRSATQFTQESYRRFRQSVQ